MYNESISFYTKFFSKSSTWKEKIEAIPEAYSEPCWISKTKRFAKNVNGWNPINILAKHSILDIWQGFE